MVAEPRRDARGVRRRRLAASVLASACLLVVAAAQPEELTPGRVSAAAAADATTLDVGVLTTTCGATCASVAGATACLGVGVDQAACAASRQMRGRATCQPLAGSTSASALCLAPADAARWMLLLTRDPELLALAQGGVAITDDSDLQNAIVLNASDVGAIKSFPLPATATQLTLRPAPTAAASDSTEQLSLSLSSDVVAGWTSLEQLSIRSIDLSNLQSFPAFPKLGSLDVSGCQLKTWSAGAMPALSNLDVSSNKLTALPKGSLPPSLNVLNVSSNQLVEFPVDIASLPSLFKLSMSNNNLASLTEFPKLPALQELYLSSSSLSAVPSGIANLPALQVLDLSKNNFAAAMANAFPASLNSLKLRSCNLKMLPGDFGIEKTWELVDLSENPFSEGAFAGVKLRANNLILDQVQLTSVSPNIKTWAVGNKLSLSRNALGAVDAESLPLDIAELRLADCFLTEVPPNLTSLRRLTILDLSENRFGPIFKGTIPTSLTELYLAGCQLNKIPPDVDAMKSTLQKLDLSGNNLTQVVLSGFSGLRSLNLRNNSLTAVPPSIFQMSSLSSLDLRGNPITNIRLTDDEIAFVSKLRTFEVDQSAFEVKGKCIESVVVRGKYTLCKNAIATAAPEPVINDPIGSVPAPAPQPSPSPSKSSSTTLNIILGCAVALVMIVSILVARMSPRRSSLDNETYDPLATASNRYGPLDMWDDPDLLALRVDILDIELVMQIGIGANSVIWLARYQTDTVVVKRLYHKRSDPRAFERFVEEIKFLGRLVHENIVQFIGVSWTSDSDLQMLLEFMAHGDLHKHLKTTRADESARPWSARKIRIAMDVARALTYLHSHDPALLHRDLRSHHVLLNEKYTAKLTDFGMCRHRAEDLEIMAMGGNSSRSIAPEVLSGRGSFGKAVDMYAFGVILAELDSHELPFSDITLSSGAPLSEMAMLELLSTGALQPSITPDCPPDISMLILDCLSFDSNRRPSAPAALQRLQVVLDSFQALGGAPHDGDDSSRRIAGSYFDSKQEDDDE